MNGAARPPTAAKESEALISVRVHPKVSSIGTMNSPNAYCDTPTATAVDEKTTAMIRAPRKVRCRVAWSGRGGAMLHHASRPDGPSRPRAGVGSRLQARSA